MWTLSPAADAYRRREQERINAILKEQKADPVTEYELDLRCFRMLPFGVPGPGIPNFRHEFLIRCWNHESGEADVIELDGVANYWEVRKAKALCRYKRLIMLGCASSAKTHRSAAYGKTLWKSNPFGTSVYLSTTSAEAGEARTWGMVKALQKADKFRIGKLIDSLRVITLDEETRNEDGEKERDYRNCIKAVLIKPGADGKNVVGSICGRKNKNVIWICDEMPFMDIGVLDARVNLFSNEFAQFIGIGNAPEEGDPMYIDAEPYGPQFPDGWRSVDKDVHEFWPTKTGMCLYFNGEKSPNIKGIQRGKKGVFPGLMDWPKYEEILATAGGEDTPIFWKQFYGFPPSSDIPDKIVTHKLITSNKADTVPLWEQPAVKFGAGLDLGFREGGDPCVISFFRLGKNTDGRTVMQFEKDGIVLNPSQQSREAFETQIAYKVVTECSKRGCHDLALDISGDGGMILQAIERVSRTEGYTLNVTPISFLGAAEKRIVVPGETRMASDMFDRMVSQLWTTFRLSIQNGVIYGLDVHSNAVSQLCARRFTTDERKRFSVEKKSDMKKRLKRSPDHADSYVVAHALALKMGLSGQKAIKQPPKAQDSPADYSEAPKKSLYATGHSKRQLYR